MKTENDKLSLLPFQAESVEKALNILDMVPSKAVYIANEQGTGKTPIALELSRALLSNLEHSRTLIVCPAVMKYIWETEINRWLPGRSVQVIRSTKDAVLPDAEFIVVSYDSLWRKPLMERLSVKPIDLLICDEAHLIKETKAKRSLAIYRTFFKISKYKVLLSGTPMTRAAVDLYAPFHAIDPAYPPFANFISFSDRYSYCRPAPTGRGKIYFGIKNGEELSKRIRSTFFIRYRKAEVLPQLPQKLYQEVALDESVSIKPVYNSDLEYLRIADALMKGLPAPKALSKSMAEHRRLQGEAKVPYVADYAEELLEQNIPVVIFAHHRNVIDQLALKLDKFKPVVITGDTKAKDRAEYVRQFQAGEVSCFIGNFQAAGVGITLSRSANVLLAELDYTPAVLSQAIDRCHRIGSRHESICIHYFIVRNSIDEKLSRMLIQKAKDTKVVIDGENYQKDS